MHLILSVKIFVLPAFKFPRKFYRLKIGLGKNNEPEIYKQIDKIMLPGDFIAMKLTGEITTSASALSEGILYDFKKNEYFFRCYELFWF